MDKKPNLEIKTTQKLEQKIAPMLIQTMKILQLSTIELIDHIQEELEENPFLEETSEENEEEEEEKPMEEEIDTDFPVNIDWIDDYFNNDYTDVRYFQNDDYDSTYYENVLTESNTLHEHLNWQLRLFSSDDRFLKLGDFIIWNIGDDGFFRMSNYEVQEYLKEEIPDLTIGEIEEAIKTIQKFDPVGVCARNIQETLLIQLEYRGLKDSWAYIIARDHYDKMINNKTRKIAQSLNITDDTLKEALSVISTLEPNPGREFMEVETKYIIPDVIIHEVDGKYVFTLNERDIPPIRISKLYKKLLIKKKKGNLSPQQKEYIYKKLNNAMLLLKGIDQRRKTLYRVTEAIFKVQRDFLKDGVRSIKPLTLKEIAEIIDMHEATVSRVTKNKYVQTPKGIYPLKYFFSSKLHTDDGEDVSSKIVKERIKGIILQEDKTRPLSDKKIAEMLKHEDGIQISRRAITKYREQLGILASYLRKEKI